jgi:hypothetical protein
MGATRYHLEVERAKFWVLLAKTSWKSHFTQDIIEGYSTYNREALNREDALLHYWSRTGFNG